MKVSVNVFSFIIFGLAAAGVKAEMKPVTPPGELKWSADDKESARNRCFEKFCVSVEEDKWKLPTERTPKSERLMKSDPYSVYSNDNSNTSTDNKSLNIRIR